MYAELPADIRHAPPYHMEEEIRAQPAAVMRSLALIESEGAPVIDLLRGARRIILTGCGTSYHGAMAGAYLFRLFSRGTIDARAVQAFELTAYPGDVGPGDAVIGLTHSGVTAATLNALRQAREAGASTIALTGFPEAKVREAADFTVRTGYDEERSWAHTVSYTAALASLAALANALAHPDERLDLAPLGEVMAEALQLAGPMHRLAAGAATAAREGRLAPIVLAGGGPNEATAVEGALKLLETAWLPAAGWELEQILHGPLAAVPPGSLFFLIAPSGNSLARAVQLAGALEEIGVTPVVLTDEETAPRFENAHRFLLPNIPEALTPIPYVVPLQWFSYYLAAGLDHNPDLIHRDDERYRRAAGRY